MLLKEAIDSVCIFKMFASLEADGLIGMTAPSCLKPKQEVRLVRLTSRKRKPNMRGKSRNPWSPEGKAIDRLNIGEKARFPRSRYVRVRGIVRHRNKAAGRKIYQYELDGDFSLVKRIS